MKKAINFFLIFFFFHEPTYSNDIQIFQQIEIKNIQNFNKLFRKVCSSERFFKNLISHKSYPNFGKVDDWKKLCTQIKNKKLNTNHLVNTNFKIRNISTKYGILTGYYEPKIKVSLKKTSLYSVPILKYNKKFIGVKRYVINKNFKESDVILWTNDIIDFFFLQIQGSGVGVFENGEQIKIQYSGNNNLKYTSIGKILLEKNFLDGKDINLFTIKEFLRKNPNKISSILNKNDRYIFFKIGSSNGINPLGAFGLNLIPEISIAVDKKFYPLGLPLLYKKENNKNYKPAFAIDTGSAIKGKNRADLFTGSGENAEKSAGVLKKKLLLYILVPYSN